jgi:hypothetical protein
MPGRTECAENPASHETDQVRVMLNSRVLIKFEYGCFITPDDSDTSLLMLSHLTRLSNILAGEGRKGEL